mgnify:CR=1 FL=1
MSVAESIVTRLLENLDPEEFCADFEMRNLDIADTPMVTDGRRVYRVRERKDGYLRAIGYIYRDENYDYGWQAYEAFSQGNRDDYVGRYYLGGAWFKTPQEAAVDLYRKWQKT